MTPSMPNVLITGSSKGIGFATALAFGRAGYTVAATMRDPARAPELARVAAAEALPIRVSAMDVDDDRSVADGVARITRELGTIDVLVNNAGIERTGSIEETPLAEIRAVMETNYFGAIRCIQAALPAMRERGNGCIINVSSCAGQIAISPLGSYSASKSALEAISEALAQEVKAFNIRVAIVEPGIVDTPMAHGIGTAKPVSLYPQQRRNAGLFATMLKQPVPPSLVAEKILEIAAGESWQLRYPVGPDAVPFLGWRKAMTDEEWVEFGALGDDAWYDRMQLDFGVDARVGS
jgi:NAD(P)-dependent dehydrogenase (short-subunit alcohol dehydrogenase family)